MTTLLLDAGALLAAFDTDDRHHDTARTLLEADEVALATLDLARYEVANVAIRAWRAPDSVAPLLAAIDRVAEDGGVVDSNGALLVRAAELADRHTISVYDAAYAAVAEATGLSLVSCDERDLVSRGLAMLPADALKDQAR